jgi:hypothetical protein
MKTHFLPMHRHRRSGMKKWGSRLPAPAISLRLTPAT